MAKYPFVVNRSKAEVVNANNYNNALNKVLSRNPNKFVKTKYAKNVEKFIQRLNENERIVSFKQGATRGAQIIFEEDFLELMLPVVTTKLKNKLFMDLMNARKKALEQSKSGGPLHVNVNNETGECTIESKANETTFASFNHGKEIAIVFKTKNKPVKVSTGSKETAIFENNLTNKQMKKSAEKTPAKKVATSKPAKAEKKEKKVGTADKKKVGSSSFFDAAQWKKVEAILKKEDLSFNAWANKLIFAKIGE